MHIIYTIGTPLMARWAIPRALALVRDVLASSKSGQGGLGENVQNVPLVHSLGVDSLCTMRALASSVAVVGDVSEVRFKK